MSKILYDKYYTPIEIANYCWDKVEEIIGFDNISEIIEPSCGNGSFYHNDKHIPHFGFDIKPECSFTNVKEGDFLTQDFPHLPGRLFIGNPPYGTNNSLAVKFYNKCCELGDYIAFILPISQLNNNLQMYKFDLIYSEDLGIKTYSGVDLHCCFNIYKRPLNLEYNPKPNPILQDVTIIERRRKKGEYQTAANKKIKPNYDYAMCNWGNGSLGKKPEYIGQYAQEVYFYCNNPKFKDEIIELLQFDKIREYVHSISMKRISVARLYMYIKENVKGIK